MTASLIVPSRPAVIRAKRCETCGCAVFDQGARQLQCHFRLRDALVPGPNGQPQAVSYFPPTQPDWFCVDGWRPKLEMMS